MARYRGPRSRLARRFREPIFGPDKALTRKPYPPGQHGVRKRRLKTSEYGKQLMEKQKLRYTYGMLEKQFRNLFYKAEQLPGLTGTNFLKLLEARLDNVVYRMGFAPTRAAARQLVSHRHILVNGRITNIPSYSVRPGDIVEIREKSKTVQSVLGSVSRRKHYSWIEVDEAALRGKFIRYPERDEVPEKVEDHLIVEFYSK